jgi:bifunctional non-homologous end joining protein LigD
VVKDPRFEVSSVPPAEGGAAHWLDPLLVAEVTHSGWAALRTLRT